MWVLGKDNIPRSYQIVYSREKHNALEGVKAKSDEGKFMVIKNTEGRDSLSEGEMVENERRGFSIGGDLGFYEWDYEASLTPKDPQ